MAHSKNAKACALAHPLSSGAGGCLSDIHLGLSKSDTVHPGVRIWKKRVGE